MIFGGDSFRRWMEWQWPFVRIGGLVVAPLAMTFMTVVRLVRASADSGQTAGEIIGLGAMMIAGGFLVVAMTWWLKAVFEIVADVRDRRK